MAVCKNCGRDNLQGKFCPGCGFKLEAENVKICTACNKEYSSGSFCVICGGRLTDVQGVKAPTYGLVCEKCSKPFESGSFCTFCGGNLKPVAPQQEKVLLKSNFNAEQNNSIGHSNIPSVRQYEKYFSEKESAGTEYGNNFNNEVAQPIDGIIQPPEQREAVMPLQEETPCPEYYQNSNWQMNDDVQEIPTQSQFKKPQTENVQTNNTDFILEQFLRQYKAEKYGLQPDEVETVEKTDAPEPIQDEYEDIYTQKAADETISEPMSKDEYEDIYTDGSSVLQNREQIDLTPDQFEDISSNYPVENEKVSEQIFEDITSYAPEAEKAEEPQEESIENYIDSAVIASLEASEEINVNLSLPKETIFSNDDFLQEQDEKELVIEEPKPIIEEQPIVFNNTDFVQEQEREPVIEESKGIIEEQNGFYGSVDYQPIQQPIPEQAQQNYVQPPMFDRPQQDFMQQPVYGQPEQNFMQQPVYGQPEQNFMQPPANARFDQPPAPIAPPMNSQQYAPAQSQGDIDPMFGPAPQMAFTVYSSGGYAPAPYAQANGQPMSKQELKAQKKAEKMRLKEEKRRLKMEKKNLK